MGKIRTRTRYVPTLSRECSHVSAALTVLLTTFCQCSSTKLICAVEAQRECFLKVISKHYSLNASLFRRQRLWRQQFYRHYSLDSAFSLIVVSIVDALCRRRFLFIYTFISLTFPLGFNLFIWRKTNNYGSKGILTCINEFLSKFVWCIIWTRTTLYKKSFMFNRKKYATLLRNLNRNSATKRMTNNY